MTERLRVAVVGAGIGRTHVAGYQQWPDFFDVRVVCDLDTARARTLADEKGVPEISPDLAALLRRDDLDLIDVCTPSHLHYSQTLAALAAGKHVICEKPIAGSLEQADALIAAEAASGRRVMPIFQYRFGNGLQKLRLLRERGVAGRAYLATAETTWRRRAEYYAVPWRGHWQTELGGALTTLAIHAHDAVMYLLGPVRRVAAHTATLVNPIETDDTTSASLEMVDGSLVSLAVTTGSAKDMSRLLFCFSGVTAISNLRPYSHTGDDWTFTGDTPELDAQIAAVLAEYEPQPEGTAGQLLRYAHALRAGQPFPVSLADARASLELMTAIYYAARTHTVVELPLAPDHPMYAGWAP
jgi:predicted dehydrogenase